MHSKILNTKFIKTLSDLLHINAYDKAKKQDYILALYKRTDKYEALISPVQIIRNINRPTRRYLNRDMRFGN